MEAAIIIRYNIRKDIKLKECLNSSSFFVISSQHFSMERKGNFQAFRREIRSKNVRTFSLLERIKTVRWSTRSTIISVSKNKIRNIFFIERNHINCQNDLPVMYIITIYTKSNLFFCWESSAVNDHVARCGSRLTNYKKIAFKKRFGFSKCAAMRPSDSSTSGDGLHVRGAHIFSLYPFSQVVYVNLDTVFSIWIKKETNALGLQILFRDYFKFVFCF